MPLASATISDALGECKNRAKERALRRSYVKARSSSARSAGMSVGLPERNTTEPETLPADSVGLRRAVIESLVELRVHRYWMSRALPAVVTGLTASLRGLSLVTLSAALPWTQIWPATSAILGELMFTDVLP